MKIKVVVAALIITAFFIVPGAAQSPPSRVALVIGMGNYKKLSRLSNPVRDATAIASVLRANHFDVSEYDDVTRADLLDALDSFSSAAEKAEVALIYYAGHGLETNGRNTIAPIDMEFSCEPQQVRRAVELDKLFEAMQHTPQQIILLDACRDDPFPSCRRSMGEGGGFRNIEISSRGNRVLVANSTLSGRRASDGPPDGHSPFAAALLARFQSDPRIPLRDLLDLVARDVALSTGNQTPEVTTRGGAPDVCLSATECSGSSAVPKATPVVPPAAAAPSCSTTDADLAFQDAIRKNTEEAYREFLSRCPNDRRKETVLGLYGRLADEELWQNVSKEDTLGGYLQYEAAFPNGTYIERAKKRETELRAASPQPAASATAVAAAAPAPPPPPPPPPLRQISKYYRNYDFNGDDISAWLENYSLETCAEACRVETRCKAFTYNTQKSICILKSGYGHPTGNPYAVSGTIGDLNVPVPASAATAQMALQSGVDYPGNDYANSRNISLDSCEALCSSDGRCKAFSYIKSKSWCWLKNDRGSPQNGSDIVSGTKN
jgi:hypothetical protein